MALAAVFAVSQQAEAVSVDYDSLTYTGTGTPPTGPYGTVHLEQVGSNVNTGADSALNGIPTVAFTGLTSSFTFTHSNISADGTGSWDYHVDCPVAMCGHGGSNPYTGTLEITIQNVNLSDVITNGSSFFGTDVCTQVINGKCTGIAGNVIVGGVPEPTTLALLGAAIIGIGLIRRRWNLM